MAYRTWSSDTLNAAVICREVTGHVFSPGPTASHHHMPSVNTSEDPTHACSADDSQRSGEQYLEGVTQRRGGVGEQHPLPGLPKIG
jgi:hypothetical protein